MLTKIMGFLMFFTGLAGILIGTSGMLGMIKELGGPEQVFLMIGGTILSVLGYLMARGAGPRPEEGDQTDEPS